MSSPPDKTYLPQAVDSERLVLGSIIIEGRDGMKRILHLLNDKDFFDQKYAIVWRAMKYLYDNQQDIDLITVHDFLQLKGYSDVIGGAAFLSELTNDYITVLHLVTHAKIVRDRATLRRIIETSQKIIDRAYNEDDLEKFLLDAESQLKAVTRQAVGADGKLNTVDLEEWRQIARDTNPVPGQVRGLSSGYKALDDLTEGFEGGEMYILTGHTGQGKSQLATNWAINVAKRGKTVLFVNSEMTKLQMARRVNNILGEETLTGKIILNDRSDIDTREVIAIMENAKEKGCDFVVVDHLHYFSTSIDNATGEISRMTRDFKEAAVHLDIPLLLLCHVDQSKPTTVRPTLKMLKNSSSIAQLADMVLTIFRDEEKNPGVLEIIRLKGRSTAGKNKWGKLYYNGLNLTEQEPLKPAESVPNFYEPKERDEVDLSVPSWANDTVAGPIIPTD